MEYNDSPKKQAYNKKYLKRHYKKNKQQYLERNAKRKMEIRQFVQSLKLKCERCNEMHPAALDFHHLNKKTKEITLGKVAEAGWSKERILKEITKCIVICSNCHRKEHWG